MKNDLQCTVRPTPEPIAELDRLGDQIAELSAHLDAARARLLELIREFDARGGWHNGFSSCAAWLTLACRARARCRPRARPRRAGSRDLAVTGPGPRAWRAVVLESP